MWISRLEYDSLFDRLAEAEKSARDWKAKYEAVANNETSVFSDCIIMSHSEYWKLYEKARGNNRQMTELQEEITKLKQMYVDEVQRRYELASLMKG